MRLRRRPTWLIYGANGYTGELIAREAARRGHAARSWPGAARRRSCRLAAELGLEHRVFALDDAARRSTPRSAR